jgi:quinol monooxygenase YgiN
MLEQKAIQVYLEHGCLGVEIYRDSEDPRRWLEVNKFHDQDHYQEVISAVDKDPRISDLFEEFLTLFETGEAPEKNTYLRML